MAGSIKHKKLTSELVGAELLSDEAWDDEHDFSGLAELIGAIFTGNTGITKPSGNAIFHVYGETAAFVRMGETAAGSNLKYGDIVFDAGTFAIKLLNDDTTIKLTPLSIGADGTTVFSGDVSLIKTGAAAISSSGDSSGAFWMADTGAGANLKRSRMIHDGGVLHFQLINDDLSLKSSPLLLNADASASFSSLVTSQTEFKVKDPDSGSAAMKTDGSANRTGWFEWRRANNDRIAYFGYVLDGANDLDLYFEQAGHLNLVNGSLKLGSWTTAGRPTGAVRLIGYNTDTNQIEFYTGSVWRSLHATPGVNVVKHNEASGVSAVDIPFPSNSWGMRIRGMWLCGTTGANLVVRTSSDGGSSYAAGGSDYNGSYFDQTGSSLSGGATGNMSYIFGSYSQHVTTLVMPFDITISSGGNGQYPHISSRSAGFGSGSQHGSLLAQGHRQSTSALTHIRLLATTGNIGAIRYLVEPI